MSLSTSPTTWIPLSAAAARVVPTSATLASSTAVRLRQLTSRLHRLGPRPTYEFLAEVVQGAPLIERFERYAKLDPEMVHALGADTLPPTIIRIK
jgi:hypothetical protein